MIRSARRSAWAARPRAAAATVLATLLVLLPSVLVAPAATSAPLSTPVTSGTAEQVDGGDPAGEGAVRIVLDDVEPAVAHVGEPVTLRGRIVNDGPQRRRLNTVTVRSAWSPLLSRADVSSWIEGDDPRETGWVLGADAIGPVVVPGAEVPFRVQVPANGLYGLPGDLAVLAVEIEATGELDAGTGPGLATAPSPDPVVLRTVLTAARAHAVAEPLEVSWVVPLTLPADPALTSRDDQERHEAWVAATGPESPARTWLETLTLPGVTWMVDPSMLLQVDPADDLDAGAGPGSDETEPASTQAPGDQQPGDDDGSTSTAGTTDAHTPGTGPGGQTPGPSPTDGPGDETTGGTDAESETSPPGGGARRGLEDGGELGYRPGSDEPAPPTAAAVERGLVTLRGLLARSSAERLWWTPSADPDVAALLALESSGATVRTAMTLPLADAPVQLERLLRRGRSDVAWPAVAALTTEEVAALDGYWASRPQTPGGAAAVIVPRESLDGGSGTPVTAAAAPVHGTGGVVALGADTRAAALLAGAADDAASLGEGAVAQRVLADSLTTYHENPAARRSMLYAPARASEVPGGVLAQMVQGFQTAPWVEHVPAADLLATAAQAPAVGLDGVPPDADVLGARLVDRVQPPASPLADRQVRSLVQLRSSLEGLAQVLEQNGAVRTWEPLFSHLWSTRWRADAEAWGQAWQGVRQPVVRVQEAVHVNPSTVNFLSDQGIVQVTVVNDLPVAVEGIRVKLVPARNLLRIVEQPEPISIGAESRATVSFRARAVTRGVTTVSARLTAPNGTVLGDEAEVSIRVQPTGVWIYWVLGTITGLVLVLGLVRTRRTQPRAAAVRTAATASGTGPTTGEEDR